MTRCKLHTRLKNTSIVSSGQWIPYLGRSNISSRAQSERQRLYSPPLPTARQLQLFQAHFALQFMPNMSDMTAANINSTPSDATPETVAGSTDPSSSPSEPGDESDTVTGPLSDTEANAPVRQYCPKDPVLPLHEHYAFEKDLNAHKSVRESEFAFRPGEKRRAYHRLGCTLVDCMSGPSPDTAQAHRTLEEMTELVSKEPAAWWDPGRARYRKQLLTDLEVTKQLVGWADLDQALLSTQQQ